MARDAVAAMEDIPYNTVKHDMESGVAKPSFTTAMIEDCMKNAGTDTSLTSMIVFVLVMVQYPDVFRKAQDELLRVVGDTRLPDYEDRASLPYLECIIKEVYRWCPAVPTAIPHQAADDDVYRGYYIPKGSMIIPNICFRAMLRDPEVYPEPDVFRPERFFGMATDKQSVMKDPKKIVFGFGRRYATGVDIESGWSKQYTCMWLIVL
ncbi:cytochrome P450 [Fomitopsis serialis]|uniref:cytochrome P450 n=1 Tax=Fomitopsis serialis TaxID=139415 RepID=UPI0020085389|nr:cytochrome P450 [Neoantrodia serialis]KAH9917087.1 cytochrome P450 [Neoantrodia serialis]